MSNNLLFNLVVSGLRDHLLNYQVTLRAVRTIVDNLLRIGVADSGKRLQLLFGGRVNVELLS
jgi:hypothetical protein